MVYIVLRNRGRGREDAAYVISAIGFALTAEAARQGAETEYHVTAWWGRWENFAQDKNMRRQDKYTGPSKVNLMNTVEQLVTAKVTNGYQIVEDRSSFPEWPILEHGQLWRATPDLLFPGSEVKTGIKL